MKRMFVSASLLITAAITAVVLLSPSSVKSDSPNDDVSSVQSKISSDISTQTNTYKDKAISESMIDVDVKQIVAKHQQLLQYPSYSQPITDKNSPYVNWNEFHDTATPVLDGKVNASLSLKKYRHFFPDTISVALITQAAVTNVKLDVISVDDQKVLTTLLSEDMRWEIKPSADWPEEIRLVAHIDFEAGEDVVSADIKLYHSVASIVGIEAPYAMDANMNIPLTLQTEQAGIYRVRANLHQRNGHAIASLVEQQRLSKGLQVVTLRAFKKVLPNELVGLELRNIMIERMSGAPGERAGYGKSETEYYDIGFFDASTLTDEEYQPSGSEQQQLIFLESLGGR